MSVVNWQPPRRLRIPPEWASVIRMAPSVTALFLAGAVALKLFGVLP